MPKKPPPEETRYPCPWPKAQRFENIKRVADYWCAGDCDRAAGLAPSLFNEILGVVLAKEQGKRIEAEEMANESKRNKDKADMLAASRAGG